MTLIFDLLTLKVVSESRVTWAIFVPILVFLGLSVLDLSPMYATDRPTDVRQKHRLIPRLLGAGHKEMTTIVLADERHLTSRQPRCRAYAGRVFSSDATTGLANIY